MGAALLLFERYGLYSLMIADSLKHFVHAAICGMLLWRRLGGFGSQGLLITFVKALLASLLMAGAAALSLPLLSDLIGAGSVFHEALLVIVSALIYAGVFLLGARLLRIQELAWLTGLLRRQVSD